MNQRSKTAAADIRIAEAKLHNERRKRQFERGWLKGNHPEIFAAMEKASAKNDERYHAGEIRRMTRVLSEK